MPKYNNEDMENAIEDVRNGLSQHKTASRHGVPRQTLRDRLVGVLPHSEAHKHQQKLSAVQERNLRDWVLVQNSLGFPPTRIQISEFAGRLSKKNGYDKPLGRRWIEGFFARHKELKATKIRRADITRFNGTTTKGIEDFFQSQQIPEIKAIPKENRYNMDECDLIEGQDHNGLVLGHADKTEALQKNPESRIWTTIVECISADGRALTPLVIFKGKTDQQQWPPEDCGFLSSWDFKSSTEEWTDDKIALTWLKTIFIPQTIPKKEGKKRLLIIDGHSSHATDDFMFECFKNGIYILWLPSHSFHVTQPLNMSVFGPVKNAYRRELSQLDSDDDSSEQSKIAFLKCYDYARKVGITQSNIIAGFEESGQWPVRATKALPKTTTDPRDQGQPETPSNIDSQPSKTQYETPQSLKQLRNVLNTVFRDEKISRPVRHLLNRIGQEMDLKNARTALCEQELEQIQNDLDEVRSKKRQKVAHGSNA